MKQESFKKLAEAGAPVGLQEANPLNVSQHGDFARGKDHSTITVGRIMESMGANKAAIVDCPYSPRMVCSYATGVYANALSLGVSDSTVFLEGTPVIVFIPDISSANGIILGALPAQIEDAEAKALAGLMDMEPGTSFKSCEAYSHLLKDLKYPSIPVALDGQAYDGVPGDWVKSNTAGMYISLRSVLLRLFGSESASLTLSPIDDRVTLTSGLYTHLSAAGEERIVNDAGWVSGIKMYTPYFCEARGATGFNKPVVKDTEPDRERFEWSSVEAEDNWMVSRYRYHEFTGLLGGYSSSFVCVPDPDQDPIQYGEKSNHRGLYNYHVGESGRLVVRSAEDIVLERTDLIAVPKQMYYPDDAAGDIVEAGELFDTVEPFEFPEDDVMAHALWFRDMMASYEKSLYQRFLEMDKDWYVPDHEKLKTPPDDYNKIYDLGKSDFSKFERRKTFVRLGKDGLVHIGEGGGAEITLGDGKVIISAPNGVELRSGTDIVSQAGRNNIIRARDSAEISATEKDVRIRSRQTHMYSEEGTLIESASEHDNQSFEGEGDQNRVNGIVLKAAKSRIFAWADTVHLSGVKQLLQEVTDKAAGVILFVANTIEAFANSYRVMAGKESILTLTEGSATLASDNVTLAGGSSTGIFKGDAVAAYYMMGADEPIPLAWRDIETNIHKELTSAHEPSFSRHYEAQEWIGLSYTDDEREKIMFKFRPAAQYGTTDLKAYESFWMYRARSGDLDGVDAGQWEEKEVNDTYPWPGKTHYEGNSWNVLTGETNYNKGKERFVPWKQVKHTGKAVKAESWNNVVYNKKG